MILSEIWISQKRGRTSFILAKGEELLETDNKISYFRTIHEQFLPFFVMDENLVYSTDDENGLLKRLGIQTYVSEDWRLYVDSSRRSLKCVLLQNVNQYASVPLAYSTKMKEKYEEIKVVLFYLLVG